MTGPMRGRLVDIVVGFNRKQRVTIELDRDFREEFDRLHGQELDVEIKKHREKRSKDANAYFHVLVNKIAQELNEADDSVKNRLLIEYGVVAKDEDGMTIGFKLPASVDVSKIYPYTRLFDQRTENGKLFNCYLVLKPTHEMDTKEMARLIDGAIEEAKELGIETDTPETLARYQAEWRRYEQEHPSKPV